MNQETTRPYVPSDRVDLAEALVDVLGDAFYGGSSVLVPGEGDEPPMVALVDGETTKVWLLSIHTAKITEAS